jgi:hypothetical protein
MAAIGLLWRPCEGSSREDFTMTLWTEKRWHFVSVAGPDGIIAVAVANLGYMGLGFAYAYERKSGRLERFEVKMPFGIGAVIPDSADEGPTRLSLPQGLLLLDPARGKLEVRSRAIKAEFDIAPAAPFDADWRIASAGAHRTRKRMGGIGQGVVQFDTGSFELSGAVLYDWSRGALARETAWRWAAGSTIMDGDKQIAWNLRTGFDDPTEAENVIWVDGVPTPLGPATIEPATGSDPWRVSAGALRLAFTPDGEHHENVDWGILASRYRQPHGRFRGYWHEQPLEGYGVVEDHWARW